MARGDLFRLIGRRLAFRVVDRYFHPAVQKWVVVGHTLDGLRRTVAREMDTVPCDERGYELAGRL